MSFTIKCDKCGQEQKLESTGERFWKKEGISIYATGHDADSIEIGIDCDCGNEAGEY